MVATSLAEVVIQQVAQMELLLADVHDPDPRVQGKVLARLSQCIWEMNAAAERRATKTDLDRLRALAKANVDAVMMPEQRLG